MAEVVVTGTGIVSAIGYSTQSFWEKLLTGASGVDFIKSFDVSDCPTRIGAEVDPLVLTNYFSRKMTTRLSKVALLGLLAAKHAIEDAGIEVKTLSEEPMGVFIGCSQGGFVESESFFKSYFDNGRVTPFAILKPMTSASASHISMYFKLHGPLMTIDSACSSANHAIGLAVTMIRSGQIERAIAGGTDTVFSPAVFRNWCTLQAMSQQNTYPQQACKPFSKNRDGTVLGEGAGMVILESKESAKRRGAHILAEVVGYGCSSDAYHITYPNVDGPAIAIQNALNFARLQPEDVDYINAHATGTMVNDLTETLAIKRVFGEHAYRVPISGIKPVVGHTLAASAALEFIACLMALRDNVIPPTINCEVADPDCDLDYVVEGKRKVELRVLMSNSFGFGGSNAVIIVRRFDEG